MNSRATERGIALPGEAESTGTPGGSPAPSARYPRLAPEPPADPAMGAPRIVTRPIQDVLPRPTMSHATASPTTENAAGHVPPGAPTSVLDAIRRGEKTSGYTHAEVGREKSLLSTKDFQLWYGQSKALHGITMSIPEHRVTALIGPSGCGKSTLLRSFNRMNDLVDGVRTDGEMSLHGRNLYDRSVDAIGLRRKIGMVFQKPNPFPMSIFENVVYPLRIGGGRVSKSQLRDACERSLRSAALWDEVKDRLNDSALGLSGGQQQRLCIARAIAAEPEVLLMDEPCSALDPIATMKIEELIHQMSGRDENGNPGSSGYTVLIVTHNMHQAARVSDYTAFMYLGRLVEYGPTAKIFQNPALPETEQYVTGRFG